MPDGLYDTDFHAWALEQAAILRRLVAARVNSPLDLEHLAEEVEDLGNSQRFAVESLLLQVILHLLKLEFSPAVEPREHWKREIITFRLDAADRIEDGPSIAGRLDLDRLYARARRRAVRLLDRDGIDPAALPDLCPYTLGQVLDPDWWPVSRHGLE